MYPKHLFLKRFSRAVIGFVSRRFRRVFGTGYVAPRAHDQAVSVGASGGGEVKLRAYSFREPATERTQPATRLASVTEKGRVAMAQKANLTPVDNSDRREAERLDLEKHARLEAGLIDPVSAIRPAPTTEHQHREGLSF